MRAEQMSERWVNATYVDDAERLGRRAGSTIHVNMAAIWVIAADEDGTRLELARKEMGPFKEPPEHFMQPEIRRFAR
jgi:hypothetical protein